MKEKLVIIGANDFQNQLILKAKKMGFETHVFAWKDGSIGEKTADVFYPISITEKDEILKICKEIRPSGVCSIASDLASITVNYVSNGLGLSCNSMETTLKCTNKYEMRKNLKDNNISTPKFIKVTNNEDTWNIDGMRFPMIVKPTDRSGSRGITKIFDKDDLKKAIYNATKDAFEKCAIVEEYIDGEEYSCEGICFEGNTHFLALTKKYTTGSPNFIETGHMEPSDIDEKYHKYIYNEIEKAVKSLGIKNSAIHAEFKFNNDGELGIIEIGARMGGDCIGSDLVFLSTGMDFIKMVIDVACGKEPDFSIVRNPSKAQIKFIFDKKDIEKMHLFTKKYPDKIYRISEINMSLLGKTIDSSTRLGYYIFCL